MAQFQAVISGNRGETSRLGSKHSGILGHIKGWSSGVKVYGYVDENGQDKFDIFMTTGSSHTQGKTFIGSVIVTDNGPAFKPK